MSRRKRAKNHLPINVEVEVGKKPENADPSTLNSPREGEVAKESGCASGLAMLAYIVLSLIGIFLGLPFLVTTFPFPLGIILVLLAIPLFPAIGEIVQGNAPPSLRGLPKLYAVNLSGLLLQLVVTCIAIGGALFQLIGVMLAMVTLVLTICVGAWFLRNVVGLDIAPGLGKEDAPLLFLLFFGFFGSGFIWFRLYVWGEDILAEKIIRVLKTLREKLL